MSKPRAMDHVGITVPDIDAAITWYCDVLGCNLLMAPMTAVADDSYFAQIAKDIYGPGFGGMRIAHLCTANGTGVELFEFSEPRTEAPADNFEYWKTGIYHIAVTDPDIEELVRSIARTGGKQRSKVWKLWPDKPYRICYCEDPWGTIVEISSHPYTMTWANYRPPHAP